MTTRQCTKLNTSAKVFSADRAALQIVWLLGRVTPTTTTTLWTIRLASELGQGHQVQCLRGEAQRPFRGIAHISMGKEAGDASGAKDEGREQYQDRHEHSQDDGDFGWPIRAVALIINGSRDQAVGG